MVQLSMCHTRVALRERILVRSHAFAALLRFGMESNSNRMIILHYIFSYYINGAAIVECGRVFKIRQLHFQFYAGASYLLLYFLNTQKKTEPHTY